MNQESKQQLQQILAQQMRDVHLPDAISWWPLAPLWWLAIAIVLISLMLVILKIRRTRKAKAYRHEANIELQRHYTKWQNDEPQSDNLYLQHANRVLKRVAIYLDSSSSKLSGEKWIDYLQRYSPKPLSEETRAALSTGLYQANTSADVKEIHKELCNWLLNHIKTTTPQSEKHSNKLDNSIEVDHV